MPSTRPWPTAGTNSAELHGLRLEMAVTGELWQWKVKLSVQSRRARRIQPLPQRCPCREG